MYVFENPNPAAIRTDDCTLRAFCIATGMEWDMVYWELCVLGNQMKTMPGDKAVYKAFLLRHGFRAKALPDTCPDCYTVREFCKDHPKGTYILACSTHVVTVKDGDYYDSWDSGEEVPVYVWKKEKNDDSI